MAETQTTVTENPSVTAVTETAPAAPAAPAAPSATPAAPAAPAETPIAAAPAERPTAEPQARPAWLPEKFKTAEDLAKSYGELEGAFGRKAEAFKTELQAELRKGVPETPDGYELTVPPDLLPPGFAANVDPKDPFLGQMRQTFHALGAKPEQFNEAAAAFLKWQVGNMPDVAAEKMKLGEGADERTAQVDRFLAKSLSEGEYRAVMGGIVTAEGVLAMEKLMRMATASGMQGMPGGGTVGTLSPEAAQATLRDPKYQDGGPEGAKLRAQFQAFVAAGGKLPGYGGGGFSR